MSQIPDIVHLELFKYTSEDFDLTLPVVNPDGSPYTFPVGTQAKCTLKKISGDGTLADYTFSTATSTIIISSNIIALKVNHSTLTGAVGDYEGEVLVNIPTGGIDIVLYVLHLNSQEGYTGNSL